MGLGKVTSEKSVKRYVELKQVCERLACFLSWLSSFFNKGMWATKGPLDWIGWQTQPDPSFFSL